MQRPTGITILAVLYVLGGGRSLTLACCEIGAGRWLSSQTAAQGYLPGLLAPDIGFRGNLLFLVGLLGLGASMMKLIAGAGLWTLQPWGWWLALLGATLKLASHLVAAFRGGITPRGVAGTLVDGAALVYLSRPHVRRALADVPIEETTTTR